jgi:hypothetical protein
MRWRALLILKEWYGWLSSNSDFFVMNLIDMKEPSKNYVLGYCV